MEEWGYERMGNGVMRFRPVGIFIVADEGISAEVQITTVVARLTDHLTGSGRSHDYHMTITQCPYNTSGSTKD